MRTYLMIGCTDPTAGLGVPPVRCASIDAMLEERRIPTRTPEWRNIYARIQVAMELTSHLNVLTFSDIDAMKERGLRSSWVPE
jgi:hypothetical protein